MSDLILQDGDLAVFLPNFAAAVVVVRPGRLGGSGPATLGRKPLCVVGDETKVAVPGCPYFSPAYPIPGVGTLKIQALAGDQKATKTRSGGKAVLLKGSRFTAVFQVTAPAQQPPPASVPDSAPMYSGSGSFVTTNIKFRGT